ncbi:MAG: FHA domain-containing protein [Kiritimatiellae bacterium]|jgi:hypothetical protein|nr:FHA domain-containing protein [Kiritimatiellia bacterium]MDD4341268.1 FHA domain-containing protein [Kiritimatiellia bacterium]MDY0149874.1 FHA domain-containing protein [Kiritimatiellia bacterium]
MYRLAFQSGRYDGKRIVVRQALMEVGRDPECHLVLSDDDGVAPRHARFEERGTGIYLSALTPDHPLRHNDQPVTDAVRLVHGDRIEIGGIRLTFQEIIAPQPRLRPSHGLLQPTTILLAAAILLVEGLLLAYLADWPRHLLRPETEAADLAFAEEQRAAKAMAAEAQAAEDATKESGSASIIRLPGTASGTTTSAPPDLVSTSAPPATNVLDSDVLEVLAEADFPPADTNSSLVDLPPISAVDPRIENAQRQLAEAVSAADFADYATAFRLFNDLHQTAPGFLPAHIAHARLLEARGQLDAARQRWGVIAGLSSPDTAFRQLANENTQRLDELRALQTHLLQTPPIVDPQALPRDIQIAGAAMQRLPADSDVAEMRILTIDLERSSTERLFQDALVQVFVTFYDQAPGSAPRPTQAITTPSPVLLGSVSRQPPTATLDATYVVPQGTRRSDAPPAYYGYTIHLFVGQVLQDAVAKPDKLLPLPIHFPDAADD